LSAWLNHNSNPTQRKYVNINSCIFFNNILCSRAQMQVWTAGTKSWWQVVWYFQQMCGVHLCSATACVMHAENSYRMQGVICMQPVITFIWIRM
jgi:hypothetical protein